MDCLRPRLPAELDIRLFPEVTLARRSGTDVVRFVGLHLAFSISVLSKGRGNQEGTHKLDMHRVDVD
jgi:hypothetical protein